MFTDSIIVIPARAGSKGFPFKNRLLFDNTARIIPEIYKERTIVSTDDPFIVKEAVEYGFQIDLRPTELSNDEASMKDVLLNLRHKLVSHETYCITLYLTYPQRKWEHLENAAIFMQQQHSNALLCRKELQTTHPFLFLKEESNHRGSQLYKHDLYRRQDYPKMFEISHFIQMCKWNELENLNSNLYNKDTVYFPIGNPVDIDTYNDYIKAISENITI